MNNEKMIIEAIKNGKLTQVLKGEDGLALEADKWVPAGSPTDWTKVISLIYQAYQSDKDLKINEEFEECLRNLLKGDAEDVYIGVSLLFLQILREESGRAPFVLDRKYLLDLCKRIIPDRKADLENCHKWAGEKDGLWKEVLRLNSILNEDYGVSFLEEKKNSFVSSAEANKLINNNILNGVKVPHSTSYPVIRLENGIYYLASFVFFYSREDMDKRKVNRPSMWALADFATGEIIRGYETKENEFSEADYNVKYDIRPEKKYDLSKEYYDEAFAHLDNVRNQVLEGKDFNFFEYNLYLNAILENIPESYKRFYKELSM